VALYLSLLIIAVLWVVFDTEKNVALSQFVILIIRIFEFVSLKTD